MTDLAKPKRGKFWLAGRSDRKEYWVFVATVMAISFALSFVPGDLSTTSFGGVVFVIQIRRFHDLGRSGWWAVALFAGEILAALAIVALLPRDVATGLATVADFAIIAIMGVIPGQPHENRFGPPRGKRSLAAVFS